VAVDLDRDAVDRVLRRASEMTAAHPGVPGSTGRMSEQVLLEAADEAGLDLDAVRISLAIERLGPMPPPVRLDRTVGPRRVAVERIMALDIDTLLRRLDDHLLRRHGMRRSRSTADRGEWRKRTDAMATVQRLARTGSVSVNLRKLGGIEARTSVIEPGRTLVRLLADRTPQRTEAVAGATAVGGFGLVATGVIAVITTPVVVVAAPVALGAGYATALTGRSRHAGLVDDLEGLLDDVERGTRPVTLTDDVRRVLRQLRS
jgi:hypothetical protein